MQLVHFLVFFFSLLIEYAVITKGLQKVTLRLSFVTRSLLRFNKGVRTLFSELIQFFKSSKSLACTSSSDDHVSAFNSSSVFKMVIGCRPITTSHIFLNSEPCKGLVKKSLSIIPVGQYSIPTCSYFSLSTIQKFLMAICRDCFPAEVRPFFKSLIVL